MIHQLLLILGALGCVALASVKQMPDATISCNVHELQVLLDSGMDVNAPSQTKIELLNTATALNNPAIISDIIVRENHYYSSAKPLYCFATNLYFMPSIYTKLSLASQAAVLRCHYQFSGHLSNLYGMARRAFNFISIFDKLRFHLNFDVSKEAEFWGCVLSKTEQYINKDPSIPFPNDLQAIFRAIFRGSSYDQVKSLLTIMKIIDSTNGPVFIVNSNPIMPANWEYGEFGIDAYEKVISALVVLDPEHKLNLDEHGQYLDDSIRLGNLHLFQAFLNLGIRLEPSSVWGTKVLTWILKYKNEHLTRAIFGHYKLHNLLSVSDKDNGACLQQKLITLLLWDQADPNRCINGDQSPLYYASKDNNMSMVDLLLSRGRETSVNCLQLARSINSAVVQGYVEIAKRLLEIYPVNVRLSLFDIDFEYVHPEIVFLLAESEYYAKLCYTTKSIIDDTIVNLLAKCQGSLGLAKYFAASLEHLSIKDATEEEIGKVIDGLREAKMHVQRGSNNLHLDHFSALLCALDKQNIFRLLEYSARACALLEETSPQ